MAYQTLCARFSKKATQAAGHGVGLLSGIALAHAGNFSTTAGIFYGMGIGSLGLFLGLASELVAEGVLRSNRVGVTRGSRIVQRAGLAGYGVALAAGLSFSSHFMPIIEAKLESLAPSATQPPKEVSVPSVSPPVPGAGFVFRSSFAATAFLLT